MLCLLAVACNANDQALSIDLTTERFTYEDGAVRTPDSASAPQAPLTKVWAFDAHEALGQPVAAEGRVLASSRYQLYAWDNRGRLRWQFRPPNNSAKDAVAVLAPWIVGEMALLVYVRNTEVVMIAFDLQTGARRWTFTRPAADATTAFVRPIGDSVILSLSFPALSDRNPGRPNVWRIDLNGAELWAKHFDSEHLDFARRGDVLAVGSETGVDMLDIKDGVVRWRYNGVPKDPKDPSGVYSIIAFRGQSLLVEEDLDTSGLAFDLFRLEDGNLLVRRVVDPGGSAEGYLTTYSAGRLSSYDSMNGRFRAWSTNHLEPGTVSYARPFVHFLLIDPTDEDPARGYYSDDEKELVFMSKSRVVWKAPLPAKGILDDLLHGNPAGGIAATGSGVFVTTTSGWLLAYAPTELVRAARAQASL